MTLQPFLYCAVTALVVLSLAWRPWREPRPAGATRAELAGTLGNTLAWTAGTFLAYHAMKARLPAFPPTEAEQWWAWATVLCIVPCLLEGHSWLLSTLLGGGIFGAFAWLSSEPLRSRSWEGAELWLQVGGALALGLVLFGLRPRPSREPAWGDGPSFPAALALATAAGAGVLGQSYGGAAHLAGALAFFPATLAVMGMFRPLRRYWPGITSAWSLGLPGLLLTGVWFAETPWVSALLVALAPQLVRIPLGRRKSPRLAAIGHGLLVALAAGAAVGLALRPSSPYAGY